METLWYVFGILAAALLVGALVRMSKADFVTMPTVKARLRPLLALALGTGWGALDYVALGSPWKDALLKGLLGAGGAMLAHELGIEKMRGGRELFDGGATPEETNRRLATELAKIKLARQSGPQLIVPGRPRPANEGVDVDLGDGVTFPDEEAPTAGPPKRKS